MNERILKLVQQAREYAWENETHWSANAERERLFEQKFAELVVGECVNIADEYDGAGSTIVSRIKQHFGVEE